MPAQLTLLLALWNVGFAGLMGFMGKRLVQGRFKRNGNFRFRDNAINTIAMQSDEHWQKICSYAGNQLIRWMAIPLSLIGIVALLIGIAAFFINVPSTHWWLLFAAAPLIFRIVVHMKTWLYVRSLS